MNPEKKKHSEYFKTKQGKPAFTRMKEMRYKTRENLWSQFSTAQEHHTIARADILLEPVCMLIYNNWKGFFAASTVNPLPRQNKAFGSYKNYSMTVKGLVTGLFLESWLGYRVTS